MSNDISHLQALLSDRDCACPHCGYNLRGLSADHCPECGKTIDISAIFKRRERLDYAWLIMLSSFVAALPWSVFFVWQRLFIRGKIHYGDDWNPTIQDYGRGLLDRPFGEGLMMLASSIWWLSVPFVYVTLVVFRRKIARWPRIVRWLLAVACLVMVLLAYRRWQWWYYHYGFNGSRYPDWPWWYIG